MMNDITKRIRRRAMRRPPLTSHVAIAAMVASLTACSGGDMNGSTPQVGSESTAPRVADVQGHLASLATSRIYFGHQSVGANVLEGVHELSGAEPGAAPLSIIRSRDVASVTGPALVEFTIGENGDPASKARDFAAVLDQKKDSTPAVALFKYCYLDVTPDTDVATLFAAHRDTVRALQARHPEVTFVHVTAPLTTVEPASKLFVKRLLGKPTSRDVNRKRNEFNALVRREFQGEPIYDLARVESSRPDGSRAYFVAGSDTVYTLAPELTDDGGHLNAAGRRAAALELLAVLSATVRNAGSDRNTRP
jgi:lysophospholipase L1-like esterase